jgi:phosphatidylinositol dimannoside acyltransferase
MTAVHDAAVVAGFRTGWWLARRLPAPLVKWCFRVGADIAWRRDGRGARRLRWNLARVCPELDERELDLLVRSALRSYLRYWSEAFRLPSLAREDVLGAFYLGGVDVVRQTVADGRGVVLALPHLANYDVAAAWFAYTTNGGLLTIAERLKPDAVYAAFVGYRSSIGMQILAADDPGAFGALQRWLTGAGVVALVADRDLSRGGVEVQFFGHPAKMPPGPAALALRTGAALMPASLWFETDRGRLGRQRGQVGAEVPVTSIKAATQELANAFAESIRQAPADWHMLQRIWPDMPSEGRARRSSRHR